MDKFLVVPFFIPHAGCPFTCVFCDQRKISGVKHAMSPVSVAPVVKKYLQTVKEIPAKVEAAFFGGNFTGLPLEEQKRWLEAAAELKRAGIITGIRLSTRPDFIDETKARLLNEYGVTAVELGVQSLDEDVLEKSYRGHTAADTSKATETLRKYGFEIIYQLMLGLPGDNARTARTTALKTICSRPDGVRIYPALILKGTTLACWYEKGIYRPWSLEETVEIGSQWFALFSLYGIRIIRMGLQASENLTLENDLLAGPYHPAYGELVESRLFLKQLTEIFCLAGCPPGKTVVMFNPRDISKVVGQRKENLAHLKERFPHSEIGLANDPGIPAGDLALIYGWKRLFLSRKEFLEKYRIKENEFFGEKGVNPCI
ncbi:MAG: radical SAM protein [Peptococcaceae bacterium]|jgi:histone acetyltransferase (RNA polymerase elongator complex component)|nr:radical SAM protein [Peptococcaceae bacterium]MDH7525461.1 radical SAM protein [Peptococcaceae bacterium]